MQSCVETYLTLVRATIDDAVTDTLNQSETLLEITREFSLLQVIKSPTRENNIQDLVFTNNTGSIYITKVYI